jgi:hypothetical protein
MPYMGGGGAGGADCPGGCCVGVENMRVYSLGPC